MQNNIFIRIFLISFLILSYNITESNAQDLNSIQKMQDSIQNVLKKLQKDMKNIRLDGTQEDEESEDSDLSKYADKADDEPLLINLPQKNIKLLSQIKPFAGAELVQFYKKSSKGFYSNFRNKKDKDKLDSVFASSSTKVLNELASIAFVETKYDAAILYLLKILEKDSSNSRVASNLGTVCIIAGVPEKAIPILEYYLQSKPNDPSLLNNCGQAYLRLGESEKAESYLRKCISKAPWHPEANASLAWINAANGNKDVAINYAKKSLESAYNSTAIELLKELTPDEKEFYKSLPAPSKDVYPASSDRIVIPELEFPLNCLDVDAYIQSVEEAKKPFAEYQTRLAEELESQVRSIDPNNIINSSLSKALKDKTFARKEKGQLIVKKAELEYLEKLDYIQENFNSIVLAKNHELARALNATDCIGEDCCRLYLPIKNKYLAEIRGPFNIYRDSYWTVTKEYALVLEYWEPILAGDLPIWQSNLSSFTRSNVLLSNAQLIMGMNLYDLTCCEPSGALQEVNIDIDISRKCGFNLTIPFFVGEFNVNCDKVKIKGGEGVVVGYEYEFKSGQSTYMAGPGFGLSNGLVNTNVAGLVYVTTDKEGNYMDTGVKGVLEASLFEIGPLSGVGAEAEISVGWEAGPSAELTGKVLSQEAIKWKSGE